MPLPVPTPDAQLFSAALKQRIADEIVAAGGWIDFAHFMTLALYAPGMGYYSGGAHKFGPAGDFVTAPELSPLFSYTLAAQVAQILALSAPQIIEVGAGSGRLAADLLAELEQRGALPERYAILELSGELRARQQQMLTQRVPHLLPRISWLDRLPEHFDGLILGNELLDALPTHRVCWEATNILEEGVVWQNGEFVWASRPASGRVREAAQVLADELILPAAYTSEINLAARDWIASMADLLGQGALLLIDYGFPRSEFYHPQRSSGSLMCHYRHHAHDDPFFWPGLQDITAHVDFTALTETACQAGLTLLGYTTQAEFLLNCGLLDVLSRTPAEESLRYLPQAQAVQTLISPAEMGDLFKVIAFGRGIDETLIGFAQHDRSERL